jgi:hypothetical protein
MDRRKARNMTELIIPATFIVLKYKVRVYIDITDFEEGADKLTLPWLGYSSMIRIRLSINGVTGTGRFRNSKLVRRKVIH